MAVFPGSDQDKVLTLVMRIEDAQQMKHEAECEIKRCEEELMEYWKVAAQYRCLKIDYRMLKRRILE